MKTFLRAKKRDFQTISFLWTMKKHISLIFVEKPVGKFMHSQESFRIWTYLSDA